ncbi:MAG: hypothetical protein IPN94_10000, partial [Sphingobacteriales bacterium]|nr:hypothetical protein [Sphingobacteriales bacterium]
WASASTSVATVSSTGVVTGVSAGTSVITYKNNNGCTQTATVTINALPTITGTLSACSPRPATSLGHLPSTGVATVSLTGVVTGSSAGTSVITHKNNNGCTKQLRLLSMPPTYGNFKCLYWS